MAKRIIPFDPPLRIAPPAPPDPRDPPRILRFKRSRGLRRSRETDPLPERRKGQITYEQYRALHDTSTPEGLLRAADRCTAILKPDGQRYAWNEFYRRCLSSTQPIAYSMSPAAVLFVDPNNTSGWLYCAPEDAFRFLRPMAARSWYYRARERMLSWRKAFGRICNPAPWERKAFGL